MGIEGGSPRWIRVSGFTQVDRSAAASVEDVRADMRTRLEDVCIFVVGSSFYRQNSSKKQEKEGERR